MQDALKAILLAGAASGLFAPFTAQAAPITFSTPVPVTDEADLDLTFTSPGATLQHAGRLGGAAVTVTSAAGRQIVFADIGANQQLAPATLPAGVSAAVYRAAGTASGGGEFGPANLFDATGTTVDTAFDGALDGAAVDATGGAIQLLFRAAGGNDLTVGQQYQIQLFASDDRSTSLAARTQRYQDTAAGTGNNSAAFAVGTSPYVIGTFTADGPTQSVFINGVAQDQEYLNAFVVTAVPEPTSLGFLGLGALGLLARRRRTA